MNKSLFQSHNDNYSLYNYDPIYLRPIFSKTPQEVCEIAFNSA